MVPVTRLAQNAAASAMLPAIQPQALEQQPSRQGHLDSQALNKAIVSGDIPSSWQVSDTTRYAIEALVASASAPGTGGNAAREQLRAAYSHPNTSAEARKLILLAACQMCELAIAQPAGAMRPEAAAAAFSTVKELSMTIALMGYHAPPGPPGNGGGALQDSIQTLANQALNKQPGDRSLELDAPIAGKSLCQAGATGLKNMTMMPDPIEAHEADPKALEQRFAAQAQEAGKTGKPAASWVNCGTRHAPHWASVIAEPGKDPSGASKVNWHLISINSANLDGETAHAVMTAIAPGNEDAIHSHNITMKDALQTGDQAALAHLALLTADKSALTSSMDQVIQASLNDLQENSLDNQLLAARCDILDAEQSGVDRAPPQAHQFAAFPFAQSMPANVAAALQAAPPTQTAPLAATPASASPAAAMPANQVKPGATPASLPPAAPPTMTPEVLVAGTRKYKNVYVHPQPVAIRRDASAGERAIFKNQLMGAKLAASSGGKPVAVWVNDGGKPVPLSMLLIASKAADGSVQWHVSSHGSSQDIDFRKHVMNQLAFMKEKVDAYKGRPDDSADASALYDCRMLDKIDNWAAAGSGSLASTIRVHHEVYLETHAENLSLIRALVQEDLLHDARSAAEDTAAARASAAVPWAVPVGPKSAQAALRLQQPAATPAVPDGMRKKFDAQEMMVVGNDVHSKADNALYGIRVDLDGRRKAEVPARFTLVEGLIQVPKEYRATRPEFGYRDPAVRFVKQIDAVPKSRALNLAEVKHLMGGGARASVEAPLLAQQQYLTHCRKAAEAGNTTQMAKLNIEFVQQHEQRLADIANARKALAAAVAVNAITRTERRSMALALMDLEECYEGPNVYADMVNLARDANRSSPAGGEGAKVQMTLFRELDGRAPDQFDSVRS
ncbi:MAG: hypothetical protein EOO28_16290 [Comamonadaceae bacterium]|nr:MAG: hypothetical protein EOO28_16290 [Comamonadaceae bacterium]